MISRCEPSAFQFAVALLPYLGFEDLYKKVQDKAAPRLGQIAASYRNAPIAKGGGRGLKSLLANAFEAVLGAVFLDAGYDAAYHYYLDRFRKGGWYERERSPLTRAD